HQVLVALDPLEVGALADGLALAPERERLPPVDVVPAGRQAKARPGIVHRGRQADGHPADVVDYLFEAREIKLDEVIYVNAGLLSDGLPGAGRTAIVQGGIDPLELSGGCLLARGAIALRTGQDRDHGVSRDAHHRGALEAGGDVQQHQGVRAPAWSAG